MQAASVWAKPSKLDKKLDFSRQNLPLSHIKEARAKALPALLCQVSYFWRVFRNIGSDFLLTGQSFTDSFVIRHSFHGFFADWTQCALICCLLGTVFADLLLMGYSFWRFVFRWLDTAFVAFSLLWLSWRSLWWFIIRHSFESMNDFFANFFAELWLIFWWLGCCGVFADSSHFSLISLILDDSTHFSLIHCWIDTALVDFSRIGYRFGRFFADWIQLLQSCFGVWIQFALMFRCLDKAFADSLLIGNSFCWLFC